MVHTRERSTPQQKLPRLKKRPWQNRIIGEAEEAPDQLLAHPDNYRIHPQHQQDVLAAVIDKVGWVQRVIVNKRTNRIIDGHLRVSLAISRQEPTVPVLYVDLSENEEALILASLDSISALGVVDEDKRDDLLDLLPEDMKDLADQIWGDVGETTEVSFTATEKYLVEVECADEQAQLALAERLSGEGYKCKVRG